MAAIDNEILALASLKKVIHDHLTTNGWSNHFEIFVAGEKGAQNKEIVEKVTDKSKQMAAPVIIVDSTNARSTYNELGGDGKDSIVLSIFVIGADKVQLKTISNSIRKKINDLSFTIYEFASVLRSVGTGEITDATVTDLSDPEHDAFAARYNAIISATLTIDTDSFI